MANDFTNPAMTVGDTWHAGGHSGAAGVGLAVPASHAPVPLGESRKTVEPLLTSLPQGDPWSMIAMAAVLVILLCDQREEVPNADILLYVDDKSCASESSQDCMNFGIKCSTWPQGKRVQGEILS